ncbi:MAG: DNA recombination protein RmuC [Gammaproteobacteria bacterium]|nr:DNA recombination protein RmuC [Gammaproteobacteria bacterium]
MTEPTTLLLIATGLVLAFGAGYWFGRRHHLRLATELAAVQARLRSEEALEAERALALARAMEQLDLRFHDLAGQQLRDNLEHFLRLAREHLGQHQQTALARLRERETAITELLRPVHESLARTAESLREIEGARQRDFGSLRQYLTDLREAHVSLQRETHKLVQALSKPQVRGQWGEISLRRLVELAGMTPHCDFEEQVHVAGEDGALRPDMVIHMPDRRDLVVDVKTPLDAYLAAVEATADEARKAALRRHAQQLAERVRLLSSKRYAEQFASAPQFVILFVPGDQFLAAALDEQPELLENAMRNGVIITTPSSFVALLKAVHYGWQNVKLAEGAEQIRRLAEDLHSRLGTFRNHLARVGAALEASVRAYNGAVGSLERNVLPGARRFVELGVRSDRVLEELEEIGTAARPVAPAAPELPPAADEPDAPA